MFGILRILKKELVELLSDARSIFLLFVIPIAFVAVIGQLRGKPYSFRVLLAGCPDRLRGELGFMKESVAIQLTLRKEVASNPLEEMRVAQYDVVANIVDFDAGEWRFYAAETDPVRLRLVRVLAQRLDRYLRVVQARSVAPATKSNDKPNSDAARDARALVETFSDLPPSTFFQYYSRTDYPPALIPEMTALVVCFLPVVIMAPGLIREAEEHTLEVLLTAPRITDFSLFFGKALYASLMALTIFLVILVEAQWLFGTGIKPNIVIVTFCLLPAILSSAFIGLGISAVCTSSPQALLATGGYLIGMGIFSGFLYPLSSAGSGFATWVSRLFPLTFATPMMKSWMYGAEPVGHAAATLGWLWLQCLVYGVIGTSLSHKRIREL